jgi:hypothetical protein
LTAPSQLLRIDALSPPGFQISEGVISASECRALANEIASGRAGRIQAGTRHLMSPPAVKTLAHSDALLTIARRWIGLGAVPYRATLFDKSGPRNWLVVWHHDTALPLEAKFESAEWGPWSVKEGVLYARALSWALACIVALRVHLDASAPENGPLRIIPGSDAEGVLPDDAVLRAGRKHPPMDCLVGQGGVMAMRPLLVHSSSKSASDAPRRVLHLEYAASLDLAPGIRLAVA